MINSRGQGHFRSLLRGVLGILGFGAVFGAWVGRGRGSVPVQLLGWLWPFVAAVGGLRAVSGLGLGVLVGLLVGSFWPGVGCFWVWGGWHSGAGLLLFGCCSCCWWGAVVGVFWEITK